MRVFKLLLVLLAVSACSQENRANRGFALPEGDVEVGRQLFVNYGCIDCHTLAGKDMADQRESSGENEGISVELGGARAKVFTYGDLVTSIINPSHRIAKGYPAEEVTTSDGKSKMAYYNEVLTVADLVDLVTFLKSEYHLMEYPKTNYPYYVYPY